MKAAVGVLSFICILILPLGALAAPVRGPLIAPTHIVFAQANANQNSRAQIYLLRGLANVFSRGMDEIGARLEAYGFAPHVLNHRGWQVSTDTIARNYRNGRTAPVILIGHSLGANAAFQIAARLQGKGIPVAYLATFDPTRRFTVPSNVRSFVNFYQNNGQGRPASFPNDRREDKVNLNLTYSADITHTNIDQNLRLQNIVIGKIRTIATW